MQNVPFTTTCPREGCTAPVSGTVSHFEGTRLDPEDWDIDITETPESCDHDNWTDAEDEKVFTAAQNAHRAAYYEGVE